VEERAELADRVLDSLDTEARRAVDEAWAAEAEDRIDAYERGEIASTSASDVFARLRNRTRR
jgi:putative addiction module component (TIGR02574 family)